tara:strand:- start:218 stop:433 length:216 start_codon:yes stop_codon:yes gene_type:complete
MSFRKTKRKPPMVIKPITLIKSGSLKLRMSLPKFKDVQTISFSGVIALTDKFTTGTNLLTITTHIKCLSKK